LARKLNAAALGSMSRAVELPKKRAERLRAGASEN
jgi:hypothetical protein